MKLVSKSAIAISVFACAAIFSFDWSNQAASRSRSKVLRRVSAGR
jgi:hypothetical protein